MISHNEASAVTSHLCALFSSGVVLFTTFAIPTLCQPSLNLLSEFYVSLTAALCASINGSAARIYAPVIKS